MFCQDEADRSECGQRNRTRLGKEENVFSGASGTVNVKICVDDGDRVYDAFRIDSRLRMHVVIRRAVTLLNILPDIIIDGSTCDLPSREGALIFG